MVPILQMTALAAVIALIICRRRILKYIGYCLNIPRATVKEAVVAAKQDRDTGWAGLRPGLNALVLPVYRITFEFADRTSLQFIVSKSVYNMFGVGNRGVLLYYDNNFRKFYTNKTLAEIVNPDKKPKPQKPRGRSNNKNRNMR
jgi:hypothetical protein